MKVYAWVMGKYFTSIVLWDGEFTYWTDEMVPSGGRKNMSTRFCKVTKSQFFYIGEL